MSTFFLLSKNQRYYFDADAIKEPITESSMKRISQAGFAEQTGGEKDYMHTGVNSNRSQRRTLENFAKSTKRSGNKERKPRPDSPESHTGAQAGSVPWEGSTRNKRDVWTVAAVPYPGAHFATFPPALIEPCIFAGTRPGDVVLDPFMGSGTTGYVALKYSREFIGIELNPEYVKLAKDRITPIAEQVRLAM